MSDALLALAFVFGAGVSLSTSWLLVSRIERIGARLGLTEALLGMLAALAADAPELTAAVTALAGQHAKIGAGVVIVEGLDLSVPTPGECEFICLPLRLEGCDGAPARAVLIK